MADKQISELTAASALDGTELVHIVQGGNSRKATVQNISRAAISGEFTLGDVASTHTPSSSAYATKGQIVDALYNCQIRAVTFYIGPDGSATYKAVIAKLDGSNVITEILATSSVIAAPASLNRPILFTFSSPAQVSDGDRIALMLVRTDGATTAVCEVAFPGAEWLTLINLPTAFKYVGTARYASVDPAVSNSVLFDTTSHVPVKLLC